MVKKVLIVEDNPLNMKLFNDVLEANGFQTICSETGDDAVSLALAFLPDLFILDIQLPHVSGIDIARMIRGTLLIKHIPILAITAYVMHGDEDRVLASGCTDYLSKPISVVKFLEHVNCLCQNDHRQSA